jgi:putative flavoprotein involved in K+ transport
MRAEVSKTTDREHFEVVVVGAGQAGLAVGYYLARRGLRFVILDAGGRIGDSWRNRWDSLLLFTPARIDGLPGMRFPGSAGLLPTKDAMADYLDTYAKRFNLPVRSGVVVGGLDRNDRHFVLTVGGPQIHADQVVVCTGANQVPKVPPFAKELDPEIVQLSAAQYRNPSALKHGDVLVVGAGNSGAEIVLEAAKDHQTWLSGRSTGRVSPAVFSRPFWWLASNLITRNTPVGRKIVSRAAGRGAPWLRIRPNDIAAAGVRRVGKVTGVEGGKPRLEDGRVLDVSNVVWCTGFTHDFGWIHLPVFDERGYPLHVRGVLESQPGAGLYFVGLPFLYGFTSALVGGIGRDAEYVTNQVTRGAR